jgi:hypothetical protein
MTLKFGVGGQSDGMISGFSRIDVLIDWAFYAICNRFVFLLVFGKQDLDHFEKV